MAELPDLSRQHQAALLQELDLTKRELAITKKELQIVEGYQPDKDKDKADKLVEVFWDFGSDPFFFRLVFCSRR